MRDLYDVNKIKWEEGEFLLGSGEMREIETEVYKGLMNGRIKFFSGLVEIKETMIGRTINVVKVFKLVAITEVDEIIKRMISGEMK